MPRKKIPREGPPSKFAPKNRPMCYNVGKHRDPRKMGQPIRIAGQAPDCEDDKEFRPKKISLPRISILEKPE